MAISWSFDALSPEAKAWSVQVNAMKEAGITGVGFVTPLTTFLVAGVNPREVMDEVTKPGRSADLFVRAVIDNKVGGLHVGGKPNEEVLLLTTDEVARTEYLLRNMQHVHLLGPVNPLVNG